MPSTFLLAWEFMSLTSWALVMAHHASPARAAGYVYLVMASFGTLSLLLAFGLLAGPSGGYAFEHPRQRRPAAWPSALVLALVLLGAGSKAGLVPLHVWLPLAHPAAPSHVSALMSGVMTKVAVYGFVRIVFDLLGPPAWWWGVVVLCSAAHRGAGRALCADAARPEAPARLQHGREHGHHLHRPRPRAGLPGQRPCRLRRRARADRRPVPRPQPLAVQEPPVLGRGRGAAPRPASATWSSWAA